MGWNIDGKSVSATDMYEARIIRSANHFRAWRVTGPGKDSRTELEPPRDLSSVRMMLTAADRVLIYAVTAQGSQVLVTKRNLEVMDVQIEQEAQDPPPAPTQAPPADDAEYKCLAVLPNGTLLKFKKLHDALSHRDVPTAARVWGRPADFLAHADMEEVMELAKKHLPDMFVGMDADNGSPDHKRGVYYALLWKALTPEQHSSTGENEETGDMATKKKASAKKPKAVKAPKAPKASAKKPKAVKAPKAPKADGEKRTYTRTDADSRIEVLAAENPKRKGSESYKRFEKYADGLTVAEFIKKGGKSADLKYDVAHGYIKLS